MKRLFSNGFRQLISPGNNHNCCQQTRWFARWQHRRPVRVIDAEDYDEEKDTLKNLPQHSEVDDVLSAAPNKVNWKQPIGKSQKEQNSEKVEKPFKFRVKPAIPLTILKRGKPKLQTVDMLETVIDEEGNFVYTKMHDNDSRISTIFVEVKSKKVKEKKDLILLEGKRLIKDALDTGCKLDYLLFSRMKEVEYLRPSLPKFGTKLYKVPYRELQVWSGLTTNPGIMGVFKIPNTETFKFSEKTLPITVICDNIREPGNLGALLRTACGVGCEEVILTKGCVNVWDSKVLRAACGAHFRLKVTKKLEWDEIRTRIPPNSGIFIADNNVLTSSAEDTEGNLAQLVESVPVFPYYGVDFSKPDSLVLIIGGETEGVSSESYEFAAEFNGVRLNVPLDNNVESLNTGTALGVIAFEMKRQLLIKKSCKN